MAQTESRFGKKKREAKQRGYTWEITEAQFNCLILLPCIYCGRRPPGGIDRKNNKIGYTSKNVVPCCKPCNTKKGRKSEREWGEEMFNRGGFLNHTIKSAVDAHGGVKAVADRLKMSTQSIYNYIHSRRKPPDNVLAFLGLEAVLSYIPRQNRKSSRVDQKGNSRRLRRRSA